VWRARVVTFPNILWKAPGVPGTIKFVGRTGREAMENAIEFVRRHCVERGYTMRGDRFLDPPDDGTRHADAHIPAARKIRFLPLRFGVVQATESAGTGNLSETGLYIITPAPLDPGNGVTLLLRVMEQQRIDLSGHVIWVTRQSRVGTPPGMGVRLAAPSRSYQDYVRQLC
jgi:Tfp pilus assembly protein PilZ